MDTISFQLSKIRTLLSTMGRTFVFSRPDKNKYGEPTGHTKDISVTGVFHENAEFLTLSNADSGKTLNRKQPMIMCLTKASSQLEQGDVVTLNQKTYKISGFDDLNQMGIAVNVCLEIIQ